MAAVLSVVGFGLLVDLPLESLSVYSLPPSIVVTAGTPIALVNHAGNLFCLTKGMNAESKT